MLGHGGILFFHDFLDDEDQLACLLNTSLLLLLILFLMPSHSL